MEVVSIQLWLHTLHLTLSYMGMKLVRPFALTTVVFAFSSVIAGCSGDSEGLGLPPVASPGEATEVPESPDASVVPADPPADPPPSNPPPTEPPDPTTDAGAPVDPGPLPVGREALCNAVSVTRPWTQAEASSLLNEVVRRYVVLKRDNDALIRQRGVGRYAGVRSATYQAVEAGNFAGAAALLAPKIKDGSNATAVAREIYGTSCIGRVYSILRASYAAIGRSAEWDAVERCGRAWDSDGLHVQQALIRNGWVSPAIGLLTDSKTLPGSATEQDLHRGLLRGVQSGSYYGVPLSKTTFIKDFMPTAGGSTVRDESEFLRLGRSTFLAVGTLRAAYHVPIVVPAAVIPDEFAPASGSARTAWLNAKTRGEPFVMESHSLREAWDPTNFEIRPLRDVIAETQNASVKYLSGTLLMAPFGTFQP